VYINQIVKSNQRLFAVDFSNRFVSLMVIKGNRKKSYKREIGGKFSIYLLDFFIEVLKNEELNINQIDCFIVATGPGKLTALRVGLSLIKALAIDKPIAGISSLPLMLSKINLEEDVLYYPTIPLSSSLFCTAGFVLKNKKLESVEKQRIVEYSEIKDMIDSDRRIVVEENDIIDANLLKAEEHYTNWSRMLEISGNRWDEFNDETLIPNYMVKPRVIIKNDCKTV